MTASQLEILLTNPNIMAFIMMLRHAEGTDAPNGYRYIFGSTKRREKLFASFADHPHVYTTYIDEDGHALRTSAAGALQITYTTWKELKSALNLPDFSPKSQNIAGLELFRRNGALKLIEEGKFSQAIEKVKNTWASLPDSKAAQPEKSLAQVKTWYQQAGGTIA